MNDDPLYRLLRIRHDHIKQLHEKIGWLEDKLARIQYTNLRQDINAESRTIEIEKLCKGKPNE
tara:strand:- start:967 stop:1155 length:189 start_codon:yes stop_codon:yes gene_type:complete